MLYHLLNLFNPEGLPYAYTSILFRSICAVLLSFFLVVALFYNTVTRQNMPNIEAKQKVQTEMLNNLDERVLSRTQSGN